MLAHSRSWRHGLCDGRLWLEAPQDLATLSLGGSGALVSAQASCSLALTLPGQRTLVSISVPSSLQMPPGPHLDTLSCLASGFGRVQAGVVQG